MISFGIFPFSWQSNVSAGTKLFGNYPIGGGNALTVNTTAKSFIADISNLTFGIYFIHIFIMRYILWHCDFIQSIESYILQTAVITVLTFVFSMLCCYIISMIPGAQYIIGYKRAR